MGFKGGLHLIVQLVKEVGGEAVKICFNYRVDRLNDAIQHNFHLLLSACCLSLSLEAIDNPKGSVDFVLVMPLSLSAECN